MRRLAAKHVAVVIALGLASACSGGGGADPTTTTRKHATSTSTAAVDPSVIPDDPRDITVAYVDAVLAALYDVQRHALQLTLDEGAVPVEAVRLVEAIYVNELATRQLSGLSKFATNHFDNFKHPAGANRVQELNVKAGTLSCVFAHATVDYAAVLTSALSVETYFALAPASREQRTAGNPTAWVIALNSTDDGTAPENPCAP